jgi:hypothetical protein
MRRLAIIVGLFVLSGFLLWVFFQTKLPPGVEEQGPESWAPWIALAGSIVSLLTGIVTLVEKLRSLWRGRAAAHSGGGGASAS